jgi:hypothetical protein
MPMMAEPTRVDLERPALKSEVRALRLFELGLCLKTAVRRDADRDTRQALEYEWHVYTEWEREVAFRFGKEMSIE